MGSLGIEGDEDEQPQHMVELSAFSIGKSEVTQAQWRAVVQAARAAGDAETKELNDDPADSKGDELPVEQVSWWDVVRFANALSRLEGREPVYVLGADAETTGVLTRKPGANGFRLPTEAEWEYAARGGETHEFAGSADVKQVAWYEENSGTKSHPVCGKAPNAYGLCDMSGNVWEWTDDWYEPYSASPQQDPPGPAQRVERGGSFSSSAIRVRVANRGMWDAGKDEVNLGFRLAGPALTTSP